jgi:hypothetical protein
MAFLWGADGEGRDKVIDLKEVMKGETFAFWT